MIKRRRCWKTILLILCFGIIDLALFLFYRVDSEAQVNLQKRLRDVSIQIRLFEQSNRKLAEKIGKPDNTLESDEGPSTEYENLRRRLVNKTQELWHFLDRKLGKVFQTNNPYKSTKEVLKLILEQRRSLLSDLLLWSKLDGYQEWRQTEAYKVGDLIQRRLHYLQHPNDCSKIKKLLCYLNSDGDLASQLVNIVYCLIVAYSTERTVIFEWKGRHNTSWEYVLYPVSVCTETYNDKIDQFSDNSAAKVVLLPSSKLKLLPPSIPNDLAHSIVRFNDDPSSWWIGQILKYVLKPKPIVVKKLKDTVAKIRFKRPIVGVLHNIRGDPQRGNDVDISEYMTHVEAYYERLKLTRPAAIRRVYLVSEDPKIVQRTRELYPSYKILSGARYESTTHTAESAVNLLVNVRLLAMSDYFVCTFGKNMSRVVYEMMQTNRVDAPTAVTSLDSVYSFSGQNQRERIAIIPHYIYEPGEMSLQVGDKIALDKHLWIGYGKGHNERSNETGLFPYYKTIEHLIRYPFPEYKQVPRETQRQLISLPSPSESELL